jgi:hypothetical protein
MRKPLMELTAGIVAVLFLSLFAAPQSQPPKRPTTPGGPESLYDKLGDTGSGGPAPSRDLTGFWAGRVAAKINPVPAMTPWGLEQFHSHKNQGEYPVAESNDPAKSCDPLGFPRNVVFMVRGIAFATMPGRTIEMFQYNRLWREIWTDGRELPKDVGGSAANSPDPRWYAYSIGHWENDNTFVVNSVGSDERTWLDNEGHPHSIDLRVEERYTRADHNNLELTVTIDDPKTYTKPFVITTEKYRWIPQQDFEEQLCVPSEEGAYLKIIGDPAFNAPKNK